MTLASETGEGMSAPRGQTVGSQSGFASLWLRPRVADAAPTPSPWPSRVELVGAVQALVEMKDGSGVRRPRRDVHGGRLPIGQRVKPQNVGPMCGVGVFHGRPRTRHCWRDGSPRVIDHLVGLRHEPGSVYTAASHSTGRSNGFREYICRRPIAECLAWPRIELAADPMQLSLRFVPTRQTSRAARAVNLRY